LGIRERLVLLLTDAPMSMYPHWTGRLPIRQPENIQRHRVLSGRSDQSLFTPLYQGQNSFCVTIRIGVR
jgi:hypothetical protein